MKKANASRYDYENYEDRDVAKAINKRDRNDASREAREKAETAMANLSLDGPLKRINDKGTAFKDAIYYDDSKRGKESQKRKPKIPLVPSRSGSKSRTDNAGVQGREGRGSAREKGKRDRPASASRTRDSLKKPATANSSSSTKTPTASSSNTMSGTEAEPTTDYPYTRNKEGRYICPVKGCETKSYSERSRFRTHYDTKHTRRAELYYCDLGHECREEPFDRHDSYLKHLRSDRHQRKQADHENKVNKTNTLF
ncbi:uncharacterized protein EAF01_010939 [Botrytis porri]|nr:uncharacterized protein EAF01_010939 [Botrytis porri]KAF7889446.1 hypothetical protein EAF01_010939 [Botrytis porri]